VGSGVGLEVCRVPSEGAGGKEVDGGGMGRFFFAMCVSRMTAMVDG
jgi:hypothetical protein